MKEKLALMFENLSRSTSMHGQRGSPKRSSITRLLFRWRMS